METTIALQLLATLGICLVSSFLMSRIFKKLSLPKMLAPLLIGLILGSG